MLTGGHGGNIGVCVGDDGVVLIHDMFAPLPGKIVAAVRTILDKPIKILLNTYVHCNRTDANANFAALGATIVAHDNTFQRHRTEQTSAMSGRRTLSAPQAAWPVLSFPESMTVHMCGYTIEAQRRSALHTLIRISPFGLSKPTSIILVIRSSMKPIRSSTLDRVGTSMA